MKSDYAKCHFCGGAVEERIQIQEPRRNDRFILIENVPMGVCGQCGERYILPDVAGQINRLLEHRTDPEKTVEVPVLGFERKVA